MNRGHVLQISSSLGMQQMMAAGNPNWSSSSSSSPYQFPPSSHHPSFFIPQLHPSYSSLPFLPSWHENNNNNNQNQELPESLSQLLLGGLVSEDDRANGLRQLIQQAKKLEEWEEHMLRNQSHDSHPVNNIVGVKQENSSRFAYGFHGSTTHENDNEDFNHHQTASLSQIMPASSSAALASSPNSSKTSFGVNVLDFSGKSEARHPPPSRSSPECNSNASGGAAKKARVQHCSSSSAQPTFKVRKEKLGDRVTALHQIVSPFGKADTASVLLEAIGYIRFLHNQIEALSLPYLGSGSPNMRQQQHSTTLTTVHGERNCMFPEDPGQLLNENNCMKMKYGNEEEPKLDLRSRGLCLVPVSCTTQVGGDNGADYWAPAALGGSGFQ